MKNRVDWVAVDWGGTNLRAFAIDKENNISDEKVSDQGIGKLQPNEFEAVLLELIEPWLSTDQVTPVYACGMVGAKQGWFEANYREVPCPPVTSDHLTVVPTLDKRIKVKILPGICQPTPPDVMRGEETQIAGLLALRPSYLGTVCLPGTHSKWISVANGEIARFTTFMTGEIFEILANRSVLRHSVAGGGWDREAFFSAAIEAVEEPQGVAEKLFGLRAGSLLDDLGPETCIARLSGMLIGQEIGLAERYWRNSEISLIGSNSTVPLYSDVLQLLKCKVNVIDPRSAVHSGMAQVIRDF